MAPSGLYARLCHAFLVIKNVLIIVTLHIKVLQGVFTQINVKTLQMLRNNHTTARTVTSLEAAGRSEETVHLSHCKLFHARDVASGNALR